MRITDWWRMRRVRRLTPVREEILRIMHRLDPGAVPYAGLLFWVPAPRLRVRAAVRALVRDGFITCVVVDRRRYRLTAAGRAFPPPRSPR